MNAVALVLFAATAHQTNMVQPGFNTVQPRNLFANAHGLPDKTAAPSNNMTRVGRQAPSIGQAPSSLNNGQRSFERRVKNGQSAVVNGLRWGYVHYRQDWQDSWFNFKCYAYTPYAYATLFPSPWYGYYSLPPYVYGPEIQFQTFPIIDWNTRYYYGQQRDLDVAIQTIIAAFQFGRDSDIEELVPRRGLVGVAINGRYEYSLPAGDFLELYEDGIINSRTTGYRINSIFMSGEYAQVIATHYYLDPWGVQRTAQHRYLLDRERRDYVIREFSVG